jgi:hypothetical protein
MMRQGKLEVGLSKAPFVDNPDVYVTYLNLIREKSSAAKEGLYFEKGSALSAMLSSLSGIPTDLKSDYPPIAALGYALAALMLYPPEKPRPRGVSYPPLDRIVGL